MGPQVREAEAVPAVVVEVEEAATAYARGKVARMGPAVRWARAELRAAGAAAALYAWTIPPCQVAPALRRATPRDCIMPPGALPQTAGTQAQPISPGTI